MHTKLQSETEAKRSHSRIRFRWEDNINACLKHRLIWLMPGSRAGSCEHDDKLLSSIKGDVFRNQLSNDQLLTSSDCKDFPYCYSIKTCRQNSNPQNECKEFYFFCSILLKEVCVRGESLTAVVQRTSVHVLITITSLFCSVVAVVLDNGQTLTVFTKTRPFSS
jgi:hypothetical protein